MARPRKSGLQYFPLDVDIFEDEKIIAACGGMEGRAEIVVIKLLCAIYRNGYFIEWTEMMRYKMLRILPGVSAGLLEQIVSRLLKWGFFDEALFRSANVLTSAAIQRRYFEITRKRITPASLPHLIVSAPEPPVSGPEKRSRFAGAAASAADAEASRKRLSGVSAPETSVSAPENTVSGVRNATNKIKVNKTKTSSPIVEDAKTTPTPTYVEKDFLKVFFADTEAIEALRISLHLPDTDALRALAAQLHSEWRLRHHVPASYPDAASHLIAHLHKRCAALAAASPPSGGSDVSGVGSRKPRRGASGLACLAEADRLARISEEMKARDDADRRRATAAQPPDDYIRSLGYDPAEVSLPQALRLSQGLAPDP